MIKNFLDSEDESSGGGSSGPKRRSQPEIISLFGSDDEKIDGDEPYVLSATPPESFAENTRRSGLAWSAGIAFFASVVFMLILGWGADLLLESSPWGMVGGIVLGSLIGFIQFFRLTSQIFRN